MNVKNHLVRGSIILVACFGIFNAVNFVMQFFMARMLSLADFGIFATLSAMVYILAIFIESIQTTISKFTTNEESRGRLKNIMKKSIRKSIKYSSILFASYLVLAIPASYILKISYPLIALNGLIILTSFLLPVTRGVLQGKKHFGALGSNMVIESVIRLVSAVLLVYLGLRVYGAVLGGIIAMVGAFAISFAPLDKILAAREEKAKTEGIGKYAKSTFFITSVIIAFYTIDILIAKAVFPEDVAGAYSIASILSKAIFWVTLPISKVLFPLTSNKENLKSKNNRLFSKALVFITLLISLALVAFLIAPDLIIRIFSGRVVESSSAILIYLGIATSLVSLANLVLLYKLSQIKHASRIDLGLMGLAFVIEVGLLFYFSWNLLVYSFAFILSSAVLLFVSLYVLNE